MLGLTVKELGEMTPRNFQNKLNGYERKVNSDMAFARHLAWLQMKVWGAKVQPHDVWPLDIDERLGTKADLPTREQTEEVIKRFKKVNPKLFRPRGDK